MMGIHAWYQQNKDQQMRAQQFYDGDMWYQANKDQQMRDQAQQILAQLFRANAQQ